jgi:hypothetical protein
MASPFFPAFLAFAYIQNIVPNLGVVWLGTSSLFDTLPNQFSDWLSWALSWSLPNILRLNCATLMSATVSTVVCCNNWWHCSVEYGMARWLWMVHCCEVCGKKRPLPTTRHCPDIRLESLTKTTEHLGLVFTLDSKWVPSECEALPVYPLSSLHSRCVRS